MRFRFCKTFVVALAWFAAAFAVRGDTIIDSIQAIVGDSVITLQQILGATLPREEMIIQQSAGQPESETKSTILALRQDAFQAMIDRQVVLQEFKRLEKDKGAKIPDSWVDEQVQNIIRDRYGGDRVRFDKELEASGMTREQFRQRQRDDIIYEGLRKQFIPDPIISPLKVETYYHQHEAQFTVPARIKFRWIHMEKSSDDTNGVTRRKLEEILSQLKDGADFDDLAKTYSTGPQHDTNDWLEIPKLNDAFRDQISKLKPGQCTGVIEISTNYLVLHVDDLAPAHVTPLNDVRDEITRNLSAQEQNRRGDAWIKRLKARTLVETF
jgi:peptidyl-prolyl cis-trans isomerase SurA